MLLKVILLLASPLFLYHSGTLNTGIEHQPYEDAEAYAVYSALLPTFWPPGNRPRTKKLIIRSETTTKKLCLKPDPDTEKIVGQAISEFVKLNKKTWLLQRHFNIESPYELIAYSEIRGAIKQGGWEKFYQQYPDSSGWVDLSAVGFNAEKTVAVVYTGHHCGMLCGGGRYHVLQKKDGKWIPLKRKIGCGWVS
jgi:hypothetical protein